MTQQELLADMMRRYPIGSVVKCLHDHIEYTITNYDNPGTDFDLFWCVGVDKYGHKRGICLKRDNQYAKLIATHIHPHFSDSDLIEFAEFCKDTKKLFELWKSSRIK